MCFMLSIVTEKGLILHGHFVSSLLSLGEKHFKDLVRTRSWTQTQMLLLCRPGATPHFGGDGDVSLGNN